MTNLPQYLIAIGFAGALVLFAYWFAQTQKVKHAQKKALGQAKTTNWDAKFNQIAQTSYNKLLQVPGLKRILLRIRKRLETLAIYDEYTLRREVMKIIFTLLTVTLLVITVLLLLRPSWLVVFWILLGILFVSGVLIDFFVYRVEARLLVQLKEFNNRVRFFYQQTKMVDDAIYDAIQFVGPEMKIQAERIYNILTSIDPDKELRKYEEVAPTRFLKVIAGLSLLVKDKGDKFTEKGSAYLRGLSAINQELNNEILYRSKLSYQLRSLSTLTLVPIFFALPIKNWAIKTFPVMQSFYDSRIGFLVEIVVYGTALICYLSIRKMREVTESSNPMSMKRVHWEQAIFDKVPFIEKICIAFSPTPYTKQHFKLKKLIKDANAPYKIEWITFHRILIGMVVFIVLTAGFLFAHARETNSILNSVMPSTIFAGELSEAEQKLYAEQTEFDKEVIARIQSSEEVISEEKLKGHIAAQLGLEVNDPKVLTAYDRIVSKWETVKNSFFKWWEFLIVIAITFAASFAPIVSLQFKRYLRFKEMETEVHQHLILISSLREFEHMSVYMILEWIERFSIVFKEPVQICLQDYDSGPDDALDQLNENVAFEPFQQIIERLKLALVRISIKESFDDIDMEREFYLDQRKEGQQRSIDSKGLAGNILGLAPIMFLVFLYLVIPLMYISVIETHSIMGSIK